MTSTHTRLTVSLALLFAPALQSCELDMCNEDAESMGGVCFPLDPAAASVVPVCGNGLCERRGYEKESATTCPADCDGGYVNRAVMLSILTVSLFNDAVANKSWPNGQVSTSADCPGGGTTSISGMAGRTGDDNFYQLGYQMSACAAEPIGIIGAVTVEGAITRSGTFNNTTGTDSAHHGGTATLTGKDADVPYGPLECVLDFDEVSTGTVAQKMGTLCGKPLRTIRYDDR